MTTAWTLEQVGRIVDAALPALPVIAAADVRPVIPGLDLWDLWPVQEADGRVAAIAGGALWFALSAPAVGDPIDRHAIARLRLLHHAAGQWHDLGNALPDGLSPGSREWSGSAIVDAGHRAITLFFTAAGRRGEAAVSFEQRLFQTRAPLAADGRPGRWSRPRQSVASDGHSYIIANQAKGAPGTIKAFRDPGYFRDPADGVAYLLFAASLAASASAFNGAIGVARAYDAAGDVWQLLPPLVTADGINNELERPHVILRDGRYYLFWSTQGSVFAPGIVAPTGLYGMVSERFRGPYLPLNGTGLVLANPPEAPMQAYSWLVLDDLRVVSFVDHHGIACAGAAGRGNFGGTPAPEYRLRIAGDRAW